MKSCRKRFTSIATKVEEEVPTNSGDKTTNITVNNNIIKVVSDFLTLEQAFEIISMYFKEVIKEKSTVETELPQQWVFHIQHLNI